ncbi:MAG: BatD family protein [Chthoniobacteraceae bacterium]|nr:BatD family protein [Chthoniobacteraceae bacterium]
MKPVFLASLRLCVGFLLVLGLLGMPGAADAASASATLSGSTAAVGETLELKITVDGADKITAPAVRAEGLDIRPSGTSSQIRMDNFNMTRSVTHTYTVTPLKEGTFAIPALQIAAGGQTITTQPLRLTVSGKAGAGSVGGGAATASKETFASAEWVLPKTSAYVGEAIPVELRLYVDARVQCQTQMPSIAGDGFTVQKLGQPQQRRVAKDGREWELVIFKTALTPAKSGKLALPSADINAVVVLPSKRQRLPDVDDFFNDPFGAFPQRQQVVIRPDPVEMEVKPLPVDGRPKEFSGAVGQFTLETKAAPENVRVGDPVTLTCVVKGVGNFDRMESPVVAGTTGWHLYPPSGKFKADDDAGISGEKTFEQALIPEAPQTEAPPVTFVFFNPSSGRYETLHGKRLALAVSGTAAPSPAAPVPAAVASGAAPAATPAPAVRDIQYLRIDPGAHVAGFDPVWRASGFWTSQSVPLAALLALSGWQWRRNRQNDGLLRRAARLRQAKEEAARVLRRADAKPDDFYGAAIRVLQLETALGRLPVGGDPAAVDAEAVLASRSLDCETAEGVRRLFAAHDELRYAGVGAGTGAAVYPDQRERVLQILAEFEKSHA